MVVTSQKNKPETPRAGRQPRNERTDRRPNDQVARSSDSPANNSARTPNRGLPNNTNSPSDLSSDQAVRQALSQLESQLKEPERRVVDDFKNRIQRGDITGEQIGEVLSDLKKPQSSREFARQLDKAGEKLNLPMEARREIQQKFGELSRFERGALQQAFDEIDEELLSEIANSDLARSASGRGTGESESTLPSSSNPESPVGGNDDLDIEQLGQEFLKDALASYDDSESGYELPPAFKQLKERAEGRGSEREMANFGNLSQKMFEEGANLFSPNATPTNRRPSGVKPGQRLDQLIAAAADKALAGDKTTDGQNKSLYSDTINNALEAVLGQAVDIADKSKTNRQQNARSGQGVQNAENNLDFPDQFGSFDNFTNSQAISSSNSTPSSSSNSSSSGGESSIDNAAATIADSVSKIKFNGQTMIYVVGLIALLAGIVFVLLRRDAIHRRKRFEAA